MRDTLLAPATLCCAWETYADVGMSPEQNQTMPSKSKYPHHLPHSDLNQSLNPHPMALQIHLCRQHPAALHAGGGPHGNTLAYQPAHYRLQPSASV